MFCGYNEAPLTMRSDPSPPSASVPAPRGYRTINSSERIGAGGNPMATAQLPLFRLLGTAPEHKRHAQLQGGHIPDNLHDLLREALDWFDRYLGPVK